MKYTVRQFNKDFPTDDACLEYLFKEQHGNNPKCPKCGKQGFYKIKNRKCYSCSDCAYQISPTADTIFYKSSTPLKDWFFAIYLMSAAKNGVSAMEIQRHLGCTYKTAWRMVNKVRTLMTQGEEKLSGVVEMDEVYLGGRRRSSNWWKEKTPVIGIVQRGGDIRVKVVEGVQTHIILNYLTENVQFGSQLYTDGALVYKKAPRIGLFHESVNHSKREYVRGNVHTNTIEGFWGQMRRSIAGTYHSVSLKHLQAYLNEQAWHYSHRFSQTPLFLLLISSSCGRSGSTGEKIVSSQVPVA